MREEKAQRRGLLSGSGWLEWNVGRGRWEMRLGSKAGPGPAKLTNHARRLGYIWKGFKVRSDFQVRGLILANSGD